MAEETSARSLVKFDVDQLTPDEIVMEDIRQGLKEAISGQTIPLTQMWEGIDVD